MTEHLRTGLAILRRKQVEHETGLSRSTIYERIKEGTFPAPIHLGPKAVGWRVADIDKWLADPLHYKAPEITSAPTSDCIEQPECDSCIKLPCHAATT
jgi:prophage regulatory protein